MWCYADNIPADLGVTYRLEIKDSFLYYLARNKCIFIKTVDRTESMITVNDDDFTWIGISHEEKWRERDSFFDFSLIFRDMRVAHAEKRKSRCTKYIFCFKGSYRSILEFLHECSGYCICIQKSQIWSRGRIVVIFRFWQPFDVEDFCFLWHIQMIEKN